MDVDEYTSFERGMPTENTMDWEKDLVEQYKDPQSNTETNARTDDSDEGEENEHDESCERRCTLDYSDALGLLGQLHWFASQNDGDLLPSINKLTDHVEQKILEQRRHGRQTFITDFFSST